LYLNDGKYKRKLVRRVDEGLSKYKYEIERQMKMAEIYEEYEESDCESILPDYEEAKIDGN